MLLAYDLEATAEEFSALKVSNDSGGNEDARIDYQQFSDFFSAKLRNADTEEQVLASFQVVTGTEAKHTITGGPVARALRRRRGVPQGEDGAG